jgi:predicted alpha/beta-fold hydrolase
MATPPYAPPLLLRSGLAMTLYSALWTKRHWRLQTPAPPPPYQPHRFRGYQDVPIHGWLVNPPGAIATIIGTYGITGRLETQWFLQALAHNAVARGFAVILFDWRAHGKTAELSPTLTADGLYEGYDFGHIADQAKALGFPSPFWFTGFSLGGQLALWGNYVTQDLAPYAHLQPQDIGGAAVICPNLDANRSLTYLMQHPLGRYVERAIAQELTRLAWQLHQLHPQAIDPDAIRRANSIRGFDHHLVIPTLGFATVADYYQASSPLPFLPHLERPTLILYAEDDPLFDPSIIPDLQRASQANSAVQLWLTRQGGHVGYLSSRACQEHWGDRDPWWAWNRLLDWCWRQSLYPSTPLDAALQPGQASVASRVTSPYPVEPRGIRSSF